jgi:tetratricopeptide (TPR) repeat protein
VLRNAATSFPENNKIQMTLAYFLERHGNWREAVDIFKLLMKKDPDNPDYQNFIGYTLADNDSELEHARQLISSALEKDPANAAYIDSLGWVWFRLGEYEKAKDLLQKAMDLMPQDPIVLLHNIEVLIKMGLMESAENLLNKALELHPMNSELQAVQQQFETDEND